MFSAITDTLVIAGKQYRYKFRALSFIGLIVLQIIVLLLASSGGMFSSNSSGMSVSIKYYAGDVVIVCTFIWIFVMAFWHTKKPYKNIDFTLVSSRVSSGLADMALLFTLSVIGGFTSSFSGMLLRVIFYFTKDNRLILDSAFRLSFSELWAGLAATVFYLFLISSAGYLFGTLIEIHNMLAIVIPAGLIGMARVQSATLTALFLWFTQEDSLLLFSGKALLTSFLLFAASILLFKRMEVRK